MIKIVKRILCKHENQSTITNFHGDAINTFGCRSWRRCNECGKIFDVTIKTPDHLEDSIVLPEGFETDNHEILFTGICKSCQDKKR